MEKAEVNHESDSCLLGSLPSFLSTSQVIDSHMAPCRNSKPFIFLIDF